VTSRWSLVGDEDDSDKRQSESGAEELAASPDLGGHGYLSFSWHARNDRWSERRTGTDGVVSILVGAG
jgi:hypothetical protein